MIYAIFGLQGDVGISTPKDLGSTAAVQQNSFLGAGRCSLAADARLMGISHHDFAMLLSRDLSEYNNLNTNSFNQINTMYVCMHACIIEFILRRAILVAATSRLCCTVTPLTALGTPFKLLDSPTEPW